MKGFFRIVGMIASGYVAYEIVDYLYKNYKRKRYSGGYPWKGDDEDDTGETQMDLDTSVECEDFFAEAEGSAP